MKDANNRVLNSFNNVTTRKHRVEVDYWENELYRPLHGGWSIPFQAIAYHFSDISGKIQFPAESISDLDSILLPAGWTWEANEEWKPDNVGKFGQVDSEGWSYASSFDALCEAAQSRSLRAERKVTNIFRRRRWTRRRVCTSDQQLRSFGAKVAWVEHLCCSMSEVVKRDAMSYSLLLQHKDARRTTCGHLVAAADDSMRETADLLSGLCSKLDAMKQFLQEKAALEALYAEKLQLFAKKWMSCGRRGEAEGAAAAAAAAAAEEAADPSSSDPGDVRGVGSERGGGSGDGDGDGDDGSVVHHAGFFSTVSRANLAISERTKEFSEMLSGPLPHDVDSLIQEASDALTECRQEGDHMRAEFVQAFKRAEQAFEAVRGCHEKFQDELLTDVEELQESVRHQCASASAAKKRVQLDASSSSSSTLSSPGGSSASSSSAIAAAAAAVAAGKGSRYSMDVTPRRASFSGEAPSVVFVSSEILAARVEQPAPRRSMSTSVAQLFNSTPSPGPGPGPGSLVGNPLAALDSWMGFQQYRSMVVASDGVLLGYNAFCKSLVKKRKKIAAVLAEFLKGTLKIFANEQFRVWQDCASMLEAVGVATNMVLVHSDVDQDGSGAGDGGQPDIDLSSREFDLCIRSSRGGGGGGSGAGSSQSSKRAYEKNLNLIMIQAAAGGGDQQQEEQSSPSPLRQQDGSSSGGGMSWSPAVYQESADHVRLSPSSAESGRHMHMNMNLSPSVFADHSQLLPIAMAGLLEFSLVPHLDGARPAADRSKMLVGLVVLTFNRVLHILRPSAVQGLGSRSRDYDDDGDGLEEAEQDEGPGPDLSAVDPGDVLLSASVRNVHASPVFIPMDGFRDAFEVVFPWKTVAQLSSGPAAGPATAAAATTVVSSVVFVAESSAEVLRWVRKISNVFADFDLGAPPASDDEEEQEEQDEVHPNPNPNPNHGARLGQEEPEEDELDAARRLGEEQLGGDEEQQQQEFEDEGDEEDDDGKNLLFVGDVADEYCMGEM